MAGKLKDLTDMKFTRLTVIEFSHMKGKHSYWRCKCDCGNYKVVRSDCLKSKLVQSCGCLNMEPKVIKHGHHGKKLYHVWGSMKHRCNNPKNKHFHRYGGRGIKVCKAWDEFQPFYDWAMSHGYKEGLTIDRINNDGNYEPSNCRWITTAEQQKNKTQRKPKKQSVTTIPKGSTATIDT